MPTPKPTTPPGTNSFGRTYQEQTAYEKAQKAKNIGKNDSNPILDFIDTLTGRKKTPSKTVAPAPNPKKTALKKAVTKKAVIPASPTH